MVNPRDNVKFKTARYRTHTYKTNGTIVYDKLLPGGSAQVGMAVRLISDDTVALTVDASRVHGEIVIVEADGKAVVKDWGVVEVPAGGESPGTALTVGEPVVGALGGVGAASPGYVRTAVAATAADVAKQRGACLNNDVLGKQVVDIAQ